MVYPYSVLKKKDRALYGEDSEDLGIPPAQPVVPDSENIAVEPPAQKAFDPQAELYNYLMQRKRSREYDLTPEAMAAKNARSDASAGLMAMNTLIPTLEKAGAEVGAVGGRVAKTILDKPSEQWIKYHADQEKGDLDERRLDMSQTSMDDRLVEYLLNQQRQKEEADTGRKFQLEKGKIEHGYNLEQDSLRHGYTMDKQREEIEAEAAKQKRQNDWKTGEDSAEHKWRSGENELDRRSRENIARLRPSAQAAAQKIPHEYQKFADDAFTKMANMSTITAYTEEQIIKMQELFDKGKIGEAISVGEGLLKSKNSLISPDVVGAEESKRIGGLLQFKTFDPTGSGAVIGRGNLFGSTPQEKNKDLQTFIDRTKAEIESARSGAIRNKKIVEKLKSTGELDFNPSGSDSSPTKNPVLSQQGDAKVRARKYLDVMKRNKDALNDPEARRFIIYYAPELKPELDELIRKAGANGK